MKTCTKCGGGSDFYRDKSTPDGLRYSCKACDKARALKWRYENHERSMASKVEWSQRPEVKVRRAEQQRASKRRHPERWAARAAVNQAIKKGTMVRQPCKECGTPNAHAHHEDYAKPLEVEWLCVKCHGIEHRTTYEGRMAAVSR